MGRAKRKQLAREDACNRVHAMVSLTNSLKDGKLNLNPNQHQVIKYHMLTLKRIIQAVVMFTLNYPQVAVKHIDNWLQKLPPTALRTRVKIGREYCTLITAPLKHPNYTRSLNQKMMPYFEMSKYGEDIAEECQEMLLIYEIKFDIEWKVAIDKFLRNPEHPPIGIYNPIFHKPPLQGQAQIHLQEILMHEWPEIIVAAGNSWFNQVHLTRPWIRILYTNANLMAAVERWVILNLGHNETRIAKWSNMHESWARYQDVVTIHKLIYWRELTNKNRAHPQDNLTRFIHYMPTSAFMIMCSFFELGNDKQLQEIHRRCY